MQAQKQHVIVLDDDPQVLKGLVLLLEDMQFSVIAASNSHQLADAALDPAHCPALLVLPFELDDNTSGIDLVNRLRTGFQQHIPAILLSHKNGLSPDRFVNEEIVVLADHTTPRELRRTISTLVKNDMVV
jgi:CheY-like chemotaxis protein